jgi:hypothetical protein
MYTIIQMKTYKDYVFLLSVVNFSLGTSAMWTTHNISNMSGHFTLADISKYFQISHDTQIKQMIKEEEEREPEEFKIKSIQDLTVQVCS